MDFMLALARELLGLLMVVSNVLVVHWGGVCYGKSSKFRTNAKRTYHFLI